MKKTSYMYDLERTPSRYDLERSPVMDLSTSSGIRDAIAVSLGSLSPLVSSFRFLGVLCSYWG